LQSTTSERSRMPRMIGVLVSCLAVLGFVSMAGATPLVPKATALFAPDVLIQVDSKCKKVDGKLVGDCKKNGKKHRDDDDDDDDHHKKGKGKGKGKQDTGLSECTIQTPNSGGGCKTGFKRVCEKMKSGKQCCGCVADKSVPGGGNEPPKDTFCCTAVPSDGTPTATVCKVGQKEAFKAAHAAVTANGKTVGQMTCNKQGGQ
jgi:hypothetical protein